jgi:hypothetical protein
MFGSCWPGTATDGWAEVAGVGICADLITADSHRAAGLGGSSRGPSTMRQSPLLIDHPPGVSSIVLIV